MASKKKTKIAQSAAQRKQKERLVKKQMGLVRRDVTVHPDDWSKIRDLEKKLNLKRIK